MPKVLILELDDSHLGRPFVIMEKINGRLMGEIILESPDEKKLELIILFCKMLVDLHALDWRPLVPDPSIYETEGPYTFINDWLLSRQRAIDHFQKHEFIPVLDWLKERCLDVPCEQRSIIHLDYHPYNVLMQDDGKALVIDWTSVDLADFRLDLAWTLLLTSTHGSPEGREIILSEYERIAGKKIEQLEYFEVAACLRRLFSISVSLSGGADKQGMRPEAVALMKQNAGPLRNVCAFLYDRTGITIPEVERLLSNEE